MSGAMQGAVAERAELGIIGLGAMGRALALNAARHGFAVLGWDVAAAPRRALQAGAAPGRVAAAPSLPDLVRALARPRRVLLLVPAAAVETVLDELVGLLEPGDVVLDGGNSWFRDTESRQEALREGGLELLGMGVSGGERGALLGPSLMAGGSTSAWARVRPLLEAVAARGAGGPCAALLGPGGAGHLVKMAHNGIEYALLEAIAEVYDLLRRGLRLDADAAAAVFAGWRRGPLDSFLMDLAARVLTVHDGETGLPLVDLVEDRADQKGTGRWTVRAAHELGVPVPAIDAAVEARLLSAHREERLAGAALLRAGRRTSYRGRPGTLETWLEDALRANQVCSFAQGLALIGAASSAYGWGISLAEVARVWTAGCIVQTPFLAAVRAAFERRPELPTLLLDREIAAQGMHARDGLVRTLAVAQRLGVPVPTLAASLAYLDGYRSVRLPQNLTQAQRDAFGAHTYRRVDHPERGPIHGPWPAP